MCLYLRPLAANLLILGFVVLFSMVSIVEAKSSGHLGFYEMRTGIGSFRDLQLPLWGDGFVGDGETRADGTVALKDSGYHVGIPAEVSLTYRWFKGNYSLDANLRLTIIKHLAGDDDAASSSFHRYCTSLIPSIKSRYLGIPYRLGANISYGRSEYLNIVNGHSITGLSVGPNLHFGSLRSVRIELEYRMNLAPQFSYLEKGSFSSKKQIENAYVQNDVLKVVATRFFKNHIIGVLGYELDRAAVIF